MTAVSPLALLTFLLLAFNTSAEVYKVVDPKTGRVTFTDNPPPHSVPSEEVELSETNTQPAFKPPEQPEEQQTGTDDSQSVVSYESIRIVQPANDSTIPPGQLNVVVQIRTTPALQDGHTIRVLMNGKTVGKPASTTSIQLSDLIRGSHTLQAQVLDSEGNLIKASDSVVIHVKRGSVNFIRS